MNVTTSIPDELYNLAKEKHFAWNECLILGIKTMQNQPFELKEGEKILDESYKAKWIASTRREKAMEKLLNKIPLKILQEAGTTPDDSPEVLSP